MGKVDGPGSTFMPSPNQPAQGMREGQPDPNSLPANHPGGPAAPVLPGQVPAGVPTK